jgi:NADH-quinone oxidoreductase subunit L
MVMPLMVLAVVALFGGGTLNPLPHNEDLWFNRMVPQPVSAAALGLGLATADADAAHGDPAHGATPVSAGDHGDAWAHALHQAHYPALIVSLLAIAGGFLLARRMYLTHATDPAEVAARFGPLHRIISNKYYVDEFYARGVVGSLHALNRSLAWFDKNLLDGLVNLSAWVCRGVAFVSGLFDSYVIDGLVNFWRGFTRSLASVLRLLQTGNARDYLTWTLVGVLILVFVLA